ncbi:hypothetical protein [Mariniluteicoccus flavus]
MARVNPLLVGWYALRVLLTHVLLDPVREGGPRPMGWSRPVRVAMGVGLLIYVTLMVAALVSGFVPDRPSGNLLLSQPGRWLVALGTSAVLYFAYVGSVHLPLPLQVLVGVLLAGPILVSVGASFMLANALGGPGPMLFFLVILPIQLASWAAMIVLGLRQRRRPLTGTWFAAAGLAFGLAYVFPHVIALIVDDGTSPSSQTMTFLTVTILTFAGMPLAIASGVAFAEITVRAMSWSMIALRPHVSTPFWMVAVALLAGGHAYLFSRNVTVDRATIGAIGVAAATALIALGAGWFALQLARSRGPVDAPRPGDIADGLPGVALLLGVASIGWALLVPFGLPIVTIQKIWAGVLAALCLALTVRAVRRAQTVPSLLYAVFTVGYAQNAWALGDRAVARDVITHPLLALVLLVALAWWGVRGQLTPSHWLIVAVGLATTLVFPWRTEIAEPINIVVQGGAGALLFGLVWRVLTDARFTREGTARFPIDARALMFAAHVLIATTAACVVVYGQQNSAYDLERQAVVGSLVMGRFTIVAVVVGLIEIARFHVDPDPEAPPPPAVLPGAARRREARVRGVSPSPGSR